MTCTRNGGVHLAPVGKQREEATAKFQSTRTAGPITRRVLILADAFASEEEDHLRLAARGNVDNRIVLRPSGVGVTRVRHIVARRKGSVRGPGKK